MPTPDFLLSRRQLRRVRVQDALGLERVGVNARLHRDRLLERLAIAADEPSAGFDLLPEGVVDTVVSLAVAEIDERTDDTLNVVLLCVGVLAADGQFARLALLADKLRLHARMLEVERPFLSLAVVAFSDALQSREGRARRSLQQRLGLDDVGELPSPVPRVREHLNDLLCATLMWVVLSSPEARDFGERSRTAFLDLHDGLSLSFTDAVLAWSSAAEAARPQVVLEAADSTFAGDALRRYVRRRGVSVLYPAQVKAITSGATLDRDQVVSLPTSSGKTLLAEFRVVASLARAPGARAIYVAPYRLLARQVERSFSIGLQPLGHTVRDLGSGFDPSVDADSLPDVAICTPERLDALLRVSVTESHSGVQAAELFRTCSVLVFDELQLLGRPGRGPRFDLILTRIRAMYPGLKILGLCAASQGADDVATWLGASEAIAGARRPTGTLEIVWETGGTLRQRVSPRPTEVAKLPRSSQAANDAANLILRLGVQYQPVLAVETSRNQAEGLARRLVSQGAALAAPWRAALTNEDTKELGSAVEEVRSLLGQQHPLARFMQQGVAFHHAGVPTHALQQIERLASLRLLRFVCATTTVAEGADLPFRAVVIPHLNFPGESGRLDRDLYLNIIGRAGRATVSVEGIVFVLDSDARTLASVVRGSLWSDTTRDRIRGRVPDVSTTSASIDDWTNYNEVQSQVMGWLGDGSSYVENQAESLGSRTFSWAAGDATDKRRVLALIDDALHDLEDQGMALAGSPYQLTSRGVGARLTGLSVPSVLRLEKAIKRGQDGWLRLLVGINALSAEIAAQIAQLVLESLEAAGQSLWLRRASTTPAGRFEALARFADGDDEAFLSSAEYNADIQLLASWMMGWSYIDLARIAPTFQHANALFGGRDESKRTSDATEYVGKLTYPASWTWTGATVLAGDLGEAFPSFIRSAIELGVPSEGASVLVRRAGVTRPTALAVASVAGSSWAGVQEWLLADGFDSDASGFTEADRGRLSALRERLLLAD